MGEPGRGALAAEEGRARGRQAEEGPAQGGGSGGQGRGRAEGHRRRAGAGRAAGAGAGAGAGGGLNCCALISTEAWVCTVSEVCVLVGALSDGRAFFLCCFVNLPFGKKKKKKKKKKS